MGTTTFVILFKHKIIATNLAIIYYVPFHCLLERTANWTLWQSHNYFNVTPLETLETQEQAYLNCYPLQTQEQACLNCYPTAYS